MSEEKNTEKGWREEARREILTKDIEEMEGMNECWCGGGKHFAKSRVVIHTSECALNNEGYYKALDVILARKKEALQAITPTS